MTYFVRSIMTGRIIRISSEFCIFFNDNKNNFPRNEIFELNVKKGQKILNERNMMENILNKLNDEALIEMFKMCVSVAKKYDLQINTTESNIIPTQNYYVLNVKNTEAKGIVSSRWIQRNWDELITLGINIMEVITGTISLSYSFGLSALMIIHGGTNTLTTVIKMFITTSIALNIGDDEADIADVNIPSTSLGMLGYGIATLAIALTGFNYRGDDFKRLWGGIGEMLDFAFGFGLSLGLRSAVKQSLSITSPQKIEILKNIIRTADRNILLRIGPTVYELLTGVLGIVNTSTDIQEYYFE